MSSAFYDSSRWACFHSQKKRICRGLRAFLRFSMALGIALSAYLKADLAQSTTLQELAQLSERFVVHKRIPLPSELRPQDTIDEIIYGNRNVGFFQSKNWKLEGDHIDISFIPPSFRYPTVLRIHTTTGRRILLQVHKATSPVPDLFKQVKVKIKQGELSHRFYLLNGALPRKSLHQASHPSNSSLDPELFRRNHHRFTYLMVINRWGEVVWIHVPTVHQTLFSSYLSAKRVGDGYYGLMFGKHSGYFEIVKYTGQIMRSFSSKDAAEPFVMHHDFETMGSRKLYAVGGEMQDLYSFTRNPADQGKTFLTDTLIGIDLLNSRYEKLLSFSKIFHPGKTPFITGDPADDKKFVLWGQPKADLDFLHINGVDYIPGQGVLVSFRNISKVGMVDRTFSKLLWTLGGEKSDTYRIISKKHRFTHQHTPFMSSKNTLVLFDNGITNRLSRVVKYRLQHKAGEAQLIWEFQPSPSLFSKDRSSVYLLPQQNLYGIYFVKPLKEHEKVASLPHRDLYYEVHSQTAAVRGILEITFPVASPGYRMIPISSLSDDPAYVQNLSSSAADKTLNNKKENRL